MDLNPFEETRSLHEELFDLSTNEELKVNFKRGYQTFWLQAGILEKYPGLQGIARKLLMAFLLSKRF